MIVLKEILGDSAEGTINGLSDISTDFGRYIIEFGYGELYSRNGLSDKIREVVAVSALIGQGNTGIPLRAHISGMLNVGWEKQEVIEIIILMIGFVGFPAAVDALKIAKSVFDEAADQ